MLCVLQENQLVARQDKCVFGASSVEFLGHVISAEGIQPTQNKIKAITSYPTPTTIKYLKAFLGLVNFYGCFIPMTSHIMAPLNQVLDGKPRRLAWDMVQQSAFDRVKRALATATTLAFPHPDGSLSITTDASDTAIGAVLQTHHGDSTRSLDFFSKTPQPPQRRNSTFDRELLAAHEAICHFRHMITDTPFNLFTDHRPLESAVTKAADAWSERQQRQLSAIAKAGASVQHLPGNMNPVADALSRIIIDNVQPGINYRLMAKQQGADPETKAYRDSVTNLQRADVDISGVSLPCDTSTGRPRPLVPLESRRAVFDIIHSLSHPFIRSTVKLVKQKFVWNKMATDIKEWIKACPQCQACKAQRHTQAPIDNIPMPTRRFSHSRRHRGTHSSIQPDALPVHRHRQVHSLVGSNLDVPCLLGIELHHTTAYHHPQSNGLVER